MGGGRGQSSWRTRRRDLAGQRGLIAVARADLLHHSRLWHLPLLRSDSGQSTPAAGQCRPRLVSFNAGRCRLIRFRARSRARLAEQAPESETPYARVGTHVFSGKHQQLIGDELLLSRDGTSRCSLSSSYYPPLTTVSPLTATDDRYPIYSPLPPRPSQLLPTLCSTHLVFTPINVHPVGSLSATQALLRSTRGSGRSRGTGRGAIGAIGGERRTDGGGEVDEDAPQMPKKRGRPRGSKNKPKVAGSTRGASSTPRGRGRGRGSRGGGRGRGAAASGSARRGDREKSMTSDSNTQSEGDGQGQAEGEEDDDD